jgi:hypothetical protein
MDQAAIMVHPMEVCKESGRPGVKVASLVIDFNKSYDRAESVLDALLDMR